MSQVTEFYVASAEQAAALVESCPRDIGVPAVFARRVDMVKIATLHRLISGGAADAGDVVGDVDVDREDGPWLFVIRDEVATAIGGLTDHRILSVAERWAATDEWLRDGGRAEELASFIRDLRDLARRADPPGLGLYLLLDS